MSSPRSTTATVFDPGRFVHTTQTATRPSRQWGERWSTVYIIVLVGAAAVGWV